MRSLQLTEYEKRRDVALCKDEVAALRAFDRQIAIARSLDSEGYDLTASCWVGTIQLGQTAIEIRPKLTVAQVMFLLMYTTDPDAWRRDPFAYASADSILEALTAGFIAHVRRATGRGLLQGYRRREESLPVLRGRVRFDDQLRRWHARMPPIEVRYDEFTEDIEENRLIRAAADRLGRLPLRSARARRDLRHFAALMKNVALVPYDPARIPEIRYTRLNEHYRGAVELARLILRCVSIEHRYGTISSTAFLIDMNRLFEDFVRTALREAIGADAASFPAGASAPAVWLDRGRRIRLEPDLSWWRDGNCVFVGDVKYKDLDDRKVPNGDIFQLLAYTTALRLANGLLVCAGTSERTDVHQIDPGDPRIEVRTLDMTQDAQRLLAQFERLARRIRGLKRSPRLAGAGVRSFARAGDVVV